MGGQPAVSTGAEPDTQPAASYTFFDLHSSSTHQFVGGSDFGVLLLCWSREGGCADFKPQVYSSRLLAGRGRDVTSLPAPFLARSSNRFYFFLAETRRRSKGQLPK